ncbi:EpsG family protein [Adlercreutzia faecimuris]|uniref:EpsG family protein n=1 Tax=Adlercreutzia faecimuris TaxID=2897341 RepID=A0ABS9WIW0_9ACTN|nr:EpsG family protein [Adlercreutzia sp. JBNU-10]
MSNSILLYPESTLVYVVVVAACCLVAYLGEGHESRSYPAIIILILAVFVGLRSIDVGIDTGHFYNHFNSPLVFGVEPGFLWLMRFVSSLGATYSYVLIIAAAITYSCFVMRLWELRDKLSFPLGVFVLCSLYLPYTMNTFRQFIVLAVLFWASRYFFRREYAKYCVIVFACMLIHKTSIIALALLALIPFQLKELKGNARTLALLFSLSMPLLIVVAGFFLLNSGALSSYLKYLIEEETGRTGLMALIKLLFIFLAFSLSRGGGYRRSLLPDTISRFIAAIAIFGICLEPLNVISPYLDRAALYFSVYQIAFFAILYKNAPGRSREFIFAGIFVICAYALYASLASNGHGIMPYSMASPLILFGSEA